MTAHGTPQVGTYIEMLRPHAFGEGCFERAVVVGCLADPGLGVVLEVEFEDAQRVQRVWPSPAFRRLE